MNLNRALRVWQRHFAVYRKLYRNSLMYNFVEPVLYLTAMGLGLGGFVSDINGQPYVNFIAPGIVASSAMISAAMECTYGSFIRMTYQKTFDAILATPVSASELVFAELMWGATKSVIFGGCIMIVIAAFGLVDSPMLILALPVLFLSGMVFSGCSLIATAKVNGIDSFSYFHTLFTTPLFLFSGIFFPLEGMPALVKTIAAFTPLYHMVNVSRSFAAGEVLPVLTSVLWLGVAAAVVTPLAIHLMKKRTLS